MSKPPTAIFNNPDMITLLLQSTPATTSELLPWITAFVVAVIGSIGAVFQRRKGREEQRQRDIRVHPSPLSVEIIAKLATKEQLDELENDIKARLGALEKFAAEERRISRDEQSKIHYRIDKIAEGLAGVQGELRSMNQNMQLLLQRSIKPATR